MMPFPTHLRDCVVPDDPAIDEATLKGQVKCPCGSVKFQLLYPGQTHDLGGQQLPCTVEIDGRYFFLIKAKCISCGKEHLLFDADFYGWEGFVCHDPEQASLPRPSLTSWKCPACGSSEHSASIGIETQGKDNFVAETGGEFAEDLWPDAFTWFDMSITCCDCGHRIDQWVSYETA